MTVERPRMENQDQNTDLAPATSEMLTRHRHDSDEDRTGSQNEPFRLRSYQAEMVEESLSSNIIVAMDTGSGKTHIALARAAAAMETCAPEQLVWFLAPTVALCEQQHRVFKENLPAFESRMLSGRDDVDHWTTQGVWDEVLKDIRIVFSTHQVLLDALTHAFVKMSRLALLIFDEAHHCTGKHPANRIMEYFYRPLASQGNTQLPRILGLSASPVQRAKATGSDLRVIEQNLNAVARTPKVHRSELVRFVHEPELLQVTYPPAPRFLAVPPLIAALYRIYDEYDVVSDPYVSELLEKSGQGDLAATKNLQSVLVKRNSYCLEQLKSLVAKSQAMWDELGPSATEWYVNQCLLRYEKMMRNVDYQEAFAWSDNEKKHLSQHLRTLPLQHGVEETPISLDRISPKVQALVDVLLAEAGPDFTGLVFVEQRVWVATLAEMLSTHPQIAPIFNIGTFVGTSSSSKRRMNVSDLAEPKHQQQTLDDFRAGRKNLILATSVLEEGIDVSNCHLVICFEPPKNLKSFIQRRGRARKQKSKYIIMLSDVDSNLRQPQTWKHLEDEMKAAYMDDLRKVELAVERESEEEQGSLCYHVPSTGALLTLDNASPHLHHFCATLGSGPYIDSRPQFTFIEEDKHKIASEVTLPLSVDRAYRKARSAASWRTERMACNDAAFQAYKTLHLAGLVNDNLLPNLQQEEDTTEFNIPYHISALVAVSPEIDTWVAIAEQQRRTPLNYHRVILEISAVGERPLSMVLLTPCEMPNLPVFMLHWNMSKSFAVKCTKLPPVLLEIHHLDAIQIITRNILLAAFSGRMHEERYDFPWLFVPTDTHHSWWDHSQLRKWINTTAGSQAALDRLQKGDIEEADWGCVKERGDMRKYFLKAIVRSPTPRPDSPEVQLQVTRVPKRRDFLHQPLGNAHTKTELLDAANCIIGNLPASYLIFALFVPSILNRFEIFMRGDILRQNLLSSVTLSTRSIVHALTASSADQAVNYQRLEFLGDCILKLITSVHLMATQLSWPESHLTSKKGMLVCNENLATATLKASLDRFIVRKSFTSPKWRPRYAADILEPEGTREQQNCSSKLLADVVESLMGAAFVEGGLNNAFLCCKALLTSEDWMPVAKASDILFNAAPTESEYMHFASLEKLIGHTFKKKVLLVEAITHASFNGSVAANASYERLEFLGDAVLDYIVTTRIFAHEPELHHSRMHGIRTSMVNANFLAFRMFETTVAQQILDHTTMKHKTTHRSLWQFMRHNNALALMESQAAAMNRHNAHRAEVNSALEMDKTFPWHVLALIDAEKHFSDLVESVIGAIYIDTHGSIPACENFVSHLGILRCLDRILRDGVNCLHPKERIGHLAGQQKVTYVDVGNHEETKTYKVQIQIGDRKVGPVVEDRKKMRAEMMAAWRTIRILEDVERDVEMSGAEEWFDAEDGGIVLEPSDV